MCGDLDSEDHLCRVVAEHANTVILSVDYRRSPEFKWPAQLEDCLRVYRWVSC
jgi:versiconal hemiacetal acetate esterase